ncbi:hypothetical protein SAMN05421810_101225 [Amycolatopsis arida]|uniref:Nuclease-related domain-containing protein n=1 Tax=Amycolatopsis arida TaxID=587909 RepID=A0A1I5KNQ8_9PSEU|nr:hypothetical protein [Amycolatopsis arida]TDX97121.1 hypothetical protein CLV69_102223 [Amycolatopsis arida]SFO86316.1 hypothetical protein SAMN05421810_101225 [Amycolatopsis arida]
MRTIRLARQPSVVSADIRAALASLGRGEMVVGGVALVGVRAPDGDEVVDAVVVLPRGVLVVVGVDLPDPAMRLTAPLHGQWRSDGWPLVGDGDSVNPATEALALADRVATRVRALPDIDTAVGTVIAVGPYVDTVEQPAAELAGPVRVLYPTPTTMLAATVSLALADRSLTVGQARRLVRALAPSVPEPNEETLAAEGFVGDPAMPAGEPGPAWSASALPTTVGPDRPASQGPRPEPAAGDDGEADPADRADHADQSSRSNPYQPEPHHPEHATTTEHFRTEPPAIPPGPRPAAAAPSDVQGTTMPAGDDAEPVPPATREPRPPAEHPGTASTEPAPDRAATVQSSTPGHRATTPGAPSARHLSRPESPAARTSTPPKDPPASGQSDVRTERPARDVHTAATSPKGAEPHPGNQAPEPSVPGEHPVTETTTPVEHPGPPAPAVATAATAARPATAPGGEPTTPSATRPAAPPGPLAAPAPPHQTGKPQRLSAATRWLPLAAIALLLGLVVLAIVLATSGGNEPPPPPPPTATETPAPAVHGVELTPRASGTAPRCSAHTTGDLQATLQGGECTALRRASFEAVVQGRRAAISVAVLSFPDERRAEEVRRIADTPGGGAVVDLATQTDQWPPPAPTFAGAAYTSKPGGTSIRLVQACWLDGPSRPNDPDLARAADAGLAVPLP